MPPRFLDANVLLHYLLRDDEHKGYRAVTLLTRIEQGEERVATSPMVVFETVFTLRRSYHVAKARIRDLVLPIIALPGVQLPDKGLYSLAFDIYVDHNVSFADAYNAAYLRRRKLSDIYSWDVDFDRLPDVQRAQP